MTLLLLYFFLKTFLQEEPAPPLYDLTTLQKEAAIKFKISSSETLNILRDLHEQYKLISYPCTTCRLLPSSLFSHVFKIVQYEPLLFSQLPLSLSL